MTDLSQQLHAAVKANNLVNVKNIVKDFGDDTASKITKPILHHAIDNDEIFNELCVKKFNLSIIDENDKTVLALLIKRGKDKLARNLLDLYPIEEVYNAFKYVGKHRFPRSNYFMHMAAEIGYLPLFEWDGIDCAYFSEYTIEHAVAHGHLNIVEWLHKNKTFYISPNNVITALKNEHTDIVKYLIDNVNGKGWDVNCFIKYAIKYSNLDIVIFLLEHPTYASYKWKFDYIVTATIKFQKFEIFKYMMENPKFSSCKWNYHDLENCIRKEYADHKNIDEYIINGIYKNFVSFIDNIQPYKQTEQEYFNEYVTGVHSNFINGVISTDKIDHAQKIVELFINKNDATNLSLLLKLPRYSHIDENFIVTTAINAKQYDIVTKYAETRQDNVISVLLKFISKN